MRIIHAFSVAAAICLAVVCVAGQGTVLVNDPTVAVVEGKLTAGERSILDESVLPAVRARLVGDACEETVEVAGILQGAFTRAGARQTLIFYQFCQTGNGLGSAGVAVIEDGKVAANQICPSCGWTVDAKALPDIDQNGVDEIALYYSGGMHQGSGGTGVDIQEFSGTALKGIGWYQAEGFTETGPVTGYKVTVKPGKVPVFYKEKYVQNAASKWRKAGTPMIFKLGAVNGNYEPVK